MLRTIATTILLGSAVCACGQPRPAISPSLETGITSSNGGGARALGNQPNISLGGTGPTDTGPTDTRRSNSRGPAL